MSNPKIVIVDANTKTLKDVARVLAQAGYEVTTATSGREGEGVVASCRPHLVLLDFVLPDIPGTEVLRRIKADPALSGVSVVLMSSLFGTTLERSADLDADADGYIVRPISSRELLARVRGILRQRELVHSLRASETRYRDQAMLLSNAQRMGHMGSWSLDIADERMVWSDETCALFGIAPDEFRGTREHFYSFVLPEDRPRLNADYSRVVTSGGLLDVQSEFRIRRPDGQVRWMMVRGNAHLDADGSIGRRFGMYMDITDRKHAEAALRESEERLRAIYEQAAVGICLISLDYRFEQVNRRFCEILGCDASYLLNFASSIDATYPDDREADAQAIAKLLAGATSITLEKRYLTRENQVVWVRLTLSVLRSPQGDPRKFIGVIEDISARQALEEQLRHSQRLASPPRRLIAQMIGSAAECGAELTRRLLALARRRSLQPTAVDERNDARQGVSPSRPRTGISI
jgi:PAS domain S-box-containing protein